MGKRGRGTPIAEEGPNGCGEGKIHKRGGENGGLRIITSYTASNNL